MTTDNTDCTDKSSTRKTNVMVNDGQYLFKNESYAIRGAVFEVYNQVGCGFLESVYQECLIREFHLQEIPFQAQPNLHISYKGEQLSLVYQPDFVCFE